MRKRIFALLPYRSRINNINAVFIATAELLLIKNVGHPRAICSTWSCSY